VRNEGSNHRHDVLLGGRWSSSTSGERIDAVSAATEEVVGSVPCAGQHEVDAAVDLARRSFEDGTWRSTSLVERSAAVLALADALATRAERTAQFASIENGTPWSASLPMNGHGPSVLVRSLVEQASSLELRTTRRGLVREGTIVREPVGVVAAIVPWNGPVNLTLGKIVPALLAGCPVIIKAAPETPLTSYSLADALAEIGLPTGTVSLLVGGPEAGRALVEHDGVDKVAFTGSTATGRWIMERCATRIRRVTMELGGKSAAVLLDDVDLDTVLPQLLPRMTLLNGQACIALTRIVVPRARHDEVVDGLTDRLRALQIGDPLVPGTDIGPLVSQRQRDRVEGYIAAGRRSDASLVLGGGRPEACPKGWFVEPTLFAGVDNAAVIAQEEIFGPVWCVIPHDGDDDAIRIANDSPYGLAGAIFSGDRARGLALADRLRAGVVGVNGWSSDPGHPFGGFKQSGLGREGGIEGFDPYLETKVIVDHSEFEGS
jgi:betaine-aldehyde dehydrogenase